MDMGLDIFATLHGIVRRAVAALPGGARGSLLLREGSRLVYRAAVGFEVASSGPLRIPSDAGPAGAAPSFGRAMPDVDRPRAVIAAAEWYRAYPHPASAAGKAEPDSSAVLVLPVYLNGEPCGYLALEQPSMAPPPAERLTILELLADSIGATLERRLLFDEKARAAQELRLLEKVLSAVAAPVDLHDLIETIGYGVKSVLPHPHWSAVDLIMLDEARETQRVYRDPRRPITSYWNNVRDGALAAGRDLRVEVDFKAGSLTGETAQSALIDEGIRRGVQGIIVAPSDPAAMEPSIQRAAEAGVPVLTIDTPPVRGSRSLVYIGTDNLAAGRLAAEVMTRLLPEGGKVSIQVNSFQSRNACERVEGFRAALAGSRITAEPPVENQFDADRGQQLALSAMQQQGDLVGAFGACSENGQSWGMAAKAAGRAGELKIVAFDVVPTTIALLRAGVIHAVVAQREYDMGHRAVDLFHQMATTSVEATLAELEGSRFIDTGVDVVTLERTPWSIALSDYLPLERARRVAARKDRPRVAADRAMEMEVLVIGMTGKGEYVSAERLPLSPSSLLDQVVSSGRSAVVDPMAGELAGLSDVDQAREQHVRTMVMVPLLARDTVIGVILLHSTEAEVCGVEELGLIERIAGTAAVAIENARLFQELRERTRDLARESEHQQELLRTINALGSPVAPVACGIIVMPLIGVVDAERAGRFIETMLREVSARKARVVLLDVTGLAMVDTLTVHHLLRASRAARLLGAEVVLVGLTPATAQRMVQEGVDLGGLVTHANLELGFVYALSKMNGKVVYHR